MSPNASTTQRHMQTPGFRRFVMLTMVLLMLWFSGPQTSPDELRSRRRLADPKANLRSPGGWYTGLSMPARARRSEGAVAQRVAARRRPGRRG